MVLLRAIDHKALGSMASPRTVVAWAWWLKEASREVGEVFAVSRPVMPSIGCLWCNGLISSEGLQREAATEIERRARSGGCTSR